MTPIAFDEFYKRLQPYATYNLPLQDAIALVDKGRAACEFFEETMFHGWYEQYKKSGMTFQEFARGMLNAWAGKEAQNV